MDEGILGVNKVFGVLDGGHLEDTLEDTLG
jgi:hypothetical protein